MFGWLTRWLDKLELKQELDREMKHLFVRSVWDELDGDHVENLNALKERYIAKGLTRKQVDRVHKNISHIELG